MLQRARHHQRWLKPFRNIVADASALPLQTGSVDLVVSNLMLEWCNEPDRIFREIRRVLRAEGLLMFATLGPDTLKELRTASSRAWGHAQLHRFIDMHDLGDALMRAGFADPVMDAETLTVTFPSAEALLTELKQAGATPHRPLRSGLAGRRRLQLLKDRFPSESAPHRFTVEAVYGHAWAGAKKRAPVAEEFVVPVTAIPRRRI
jgi:malonyl-CoA O-methyltransferase